MEGPVIKTYSKRKPVTAFKTSSTFVPKHTEHSNNVRESRLNDKTLIVDAFDDTFDRLAIGMYLLSDNSPHHNKYHTHRINQETKNKRAGVKRKKISYDSSDEDSDSNFPVKENEDYKEIAKIRKPKEKIRKVFNNKKKASSAQSKTESQLKEMMINCPTSTPKECKLRMITNVINISPIAWDKENKIGHQLKEENNIKEPTLNIKTHISPKEITEFAKPVSRALRNRIQSRDSKSIAFENREKELFNVADDQIPVGKVNTNKNNSTTKLSIEPEQSISSEQIATIQLNKNGQLLNVTPIKNKQKNESIASFVESPLLFDDKEDNQHQNYKNCSVSLNRIDKNSESITQHFTTDSKSNEELVDFQDLNAKTDNIKNENFDVSKSNTSFSPHEWSNDYNSSYEYFTEKDNTEKENLAESLKNVSTPCNNLNTENNLSTVLTNRSAIQKNELLILPRVLRRRNRNEDAIESSINMELENGNEVHNKQRIFEMSKNNIVNEDISCVKNEEQNLDNGRKINEIMKHDLFKTQSSKEMSQNDEIDKTLNDLTEINSSIISSSILKDKTKIGAVRKSKSIDNNISARKVRKDIKNGETDIIENAISEIENKQIMSKISISNDEEKFDNTTANDAVHNKIKESNSEKTINKNDEADQRFNKNKQIISDEEEKVDSTTANDAVHNKIKESNSEKTTNKNDEADQRFKKNKQIISDQEKFDSTTINDAVHNKVKESNSEKATIKNVIDQRFNKRELHILVSRLPDPTLNNKSLKLSKRRQQRTKKNLIKKPKSLSIIKNNVNNMYSLESMINESDKNKEINKSGQELCVLTSKPCDAEKSNKMFKKAKSLSVIKHNFNTQSQESSSINEAEEDKEFNESGQELSDIISKLHDPVKVTMKRNTYKHWDRPLEAITEDQENIKENSLSEEYEINKTLNNYKSQTIFLKPGKSWARSLSIVSNFHSGQNFDELAVGRGKNWSHSVKTILNMQPEGVFHNNIKKPDEETELDSNSFIIPNEIRRETNRISSIINSTQFPRRSSMRIIPSDTRSTLTNDFTHSQKHSFVTDRTRKTSVARKTSIKLRRDTLIETEDDLIRSAKDIVLKRCKQTSYLPFDDCFPDSYTNLCRKIGEGVYGEVFLYSNDSQKSVIKIIPIEGNELVNSEPQKKFHEILSEIIIAEELHKLKFGNEYKTNGFVGVNRIICVIGKYPNKLIELWNAYDEEKNSENDCPSMFDDKQLYIILELAHGGQDLEAYVFQNASESISIFYQTAISLAIAEQSLEFEHRDLHWGNILISKSDDATSTYKLNNQEISLTTKGVKVSVIDFTLSRMSYQGCKIFNDLAVDPALFTAQGEYQFDIYRMMRDNVNNDWQQFNPFTNVLWLDYTLDKMITGVRYKRKTTKVHNTAINQMKALRKEILNYKSAFELVSNCKTITSICKINDNHT